MTRHRSTIMASLAILLAVSACRTTVPSMIDRMPPVQPLPGGAPEPPIAERPARSSRDADGTEDEAAKTRAVVVGEIVDVRAFEVGTPVDAYAPREAFRWLVTFAVQEVVEGTYESEELRLVLASPLERLAYPFADVRTFRLTLDPTTGREYELTEIDPPGSKLAEEARARNAEAAGDGS